MKKFLVLGVSLLVIACSSSKKVVQPSVVKNASISQEKSVVASKEALKEVEKVVKETQKHAKSHLNETTLGYVRKYAPLAMDEMRKFKIPASITLAQGILESGSGKSQLSAKSNNHFGIKCHKGWKGERVYHDDDAKGECFRKYKYPATSYQDHSLFLSTRFRYASLFKFKQDDYKSWAKGLKKAGYATDPKYPNKLISFIEKYELYKYDKMVLKGKVDVDNLTIKTEPNIKREYQSVRSINGKGIHVVRSEDTLYSISREYGLTVEELQSLNNLSDAVIHEGDQLRLKDGAKRGDYHIVAKKETLYSISKKYNTTVEELKDKNNLKVNDLSIGQELKVN